MMSTLTCCTSDISEEISEIKENGISSVYVMLNDIDVNTKATHDSYDTWSIASFGSGDAVGFYSLSGNRNPDNEEEFDQPVVNSPMYFAGRVGNYYKFDNPDLVLDAEKVSKVNSFMYYPYYEGMPPTTESELRKGIPMRETVDGIEKCIDFMSTLYIFNVTNYQKIPLVNGMLQPQFYHQNCVLGIQRGEGFENSDDSRIWIICKYPYTDVRVYQNNYTPSSYFRFNYQYILEDGEDPMQSIDPDDPELRDIIVNKYRVWQCWQGNNYKDQETYYSVLPYNQLSPYNAVTYILIKDNYGKWQKVTDFYLNESGSKTLKNNTRYILNVKMEGLETVVKPVIIQDWNEENNITDNRKVGIHTEEDFAEWVSIYNSYCDAKSQELDISEETIEKLRKFGDGERIGEGGPIKWTFYVNSDIQLKPTEKYQINTLYDVLEGSSVYTNYSISNLRHPLINEVENGGELRSLNFDNMYIIDIEENKDPFSKYFSGALANKMNAGLITNVNINNGILVSNKIAGMVAGTISGGTVSGCKLSGDVIGVEFDDKYPGIFGDAQEGSVPIEIKNINVKELNYLKYQ